MNWFIFLVVFLLFIASLAYYKIRYPFVKHMNKIVGPDGFPIIGMALHVRMIPSDQFIGAIEYLFKEYGPIFRTWIITRPVVHIGSAKYAQKVLSSTVNIEKSYGNEMIKVFLGNCVGTMNGEKWPDRRKLLIPAFSFSILNAFIGVMVKNCRIFIERLEKEIDSEEFDIYPYVIDCTIDTIAETAMNVQLNVQKGSSKQYVKNIHKVFSLVLKRIYNPHLHWDFIYSFTKDYSVLKKTIAELHQFSAEIVKQRIKQRQEQRTKTPPREGKSGKIEEDIGGKQHTTFLDTLLNTYERGEGDLTPEIIREEVDNAMFAGYDTVAIALGMTIYLVGNHPEIQKKIQAELDSVILSDDDFLNSQTLAKLKYLEWVILEGLRLYPPAPMIVRCLKEPVTLDDYTLPAGTDVAIHFNPIHRSPENYPNPDNFDPLNFSTDRENSLNPYAFLTFSGGPRNCIGQKFAKLEEKIMLAMFFKKYEVTSMTKMKDIKLTTKVTIQPPNGLRVKIKCRT